MALDREYAHSKGRESRRFILPVDRDIDTGTHNRPVLVRCALCNWKRKTTEGRMASLQRAHFHQHHAPVVA